MRNKTLIPTHKKNISFLINCDFLLINCGWKNISNKIFFDSTPIPNSWYNSVEQQTINIEPNSIKILQTQRKIKNFFQTQPLPRFATTPTCPTAKHGIKCNRRMIKISSQICEHKHNRETFGKNNPNSPHCPLKECDKIIRIIEYSQHIRRN